MRRVGVTLTLMPLLAIPIGAEALSVQSGRLRVEISLDPWQLQFIHAERGSLLVEHGPAGPGPSGPLGFRTTTGWKHALRAASHQRRGGSVTAVLETDDPDGGRIEVEIRPAGSDVIAVEARLENGPDTDVSALGIGWVAQPGERFFGFGERSNAVDQRGNTVENWSAEGPFQEDEYPVVGAVVPPAGVRLRDDATYFPMPWLLSSRSYGLLIDNSEASYFSAGQRRRRRMEPRGRRRARGHGYRHPPGTGGPALPRVRRRFTGGRTRTLHVARRPTAGARRTTTSSS